MITRRKGPNKTRQPGQASQRVALLDPIIRRIAAHRRKIRFITKVADYANNPALISRLERAQRNLQELYAQHAAINISLVHNWAKFYSGKPGYKSLEYDELVQEGSIGLLRAVELFDPKRGSGFSIYAAYWIRQKIIRYRLRTRRKFKTTEHPGTGDTGLQDTTVPSTDNSVMLSATTTETTTQIAAALDHLDPRSRDIVQCRYGIQVEKQTLRQLAKKWSISSQRVLQIEKESLFRLRIILPNNILQ